MSKIALVTGGTRGIGAAIAQALAKQGCTVVVTYRQDHESAQQFSLNSTYADQLHVFRSDVTNDGDIDALAEVISEKFGRLDLLVNNAGRVIVPPSWRQLSRADFLTTLDTNLVGPAILTRAMLPFLERGVDTSVVNIGSIYGEIGDAHVLAYSAAKLGLETLTRSLAKELAPGIRVNAILPGHIDTEMTRSGSREFVAQVVERTPLKRLGTPEEVAHLVLFLASREAGFITGQSFTADGGYILHS